MFKRPLAILFLLLAIKWLLLLSLIWSGYIDLGPDEAQYWTWSQRLDWGYYSKPPGIAWQIWLGTTLFGNSELGVRFMSPLLATLLSLAAYRLALDCRLQPWTAFWAAAAVAFTPLGLLAGFLAITDGGLALFWILATIAFVRLFPDQNDPSPCSKGYYWIALWIFLGALFKWPIYIFWLLVPIGWALDPTMPKRHAIPAALLSLLGLFPSFIWNYSHDWATFKHVGVTMMGGHGQDPGTTPLMKGNFWEFLGAQALLIFPTLFIAGFFALRWVRSRHGELSTRLEWCATSSTLILVGYLIYAIFAKTQGNWCDYIYPVALVPISAYLLEGPVRRVKFLGGSLIASVLLSAALLAVPSLSCSDANEALCPPFRAVPFRQNLGGEELSPALVRAGYHFNEDFLFSDTYQTTSLLSFYGPEQKRAYFFNLRGARRNQFHYWPHLFQEQMGHTGYFVRLETSPHMEKLGEPEEKVIQQQLSPFFEKVELVERYPLVTWKGHVVKTAWIYRCVGYQGGEPKGPELF